MKYRVNWYMGDRGQKAYIVECNDTDPDDSDEWFDLDIIELEDENIITDIVNLLNTKCSNQSTHKHNKGNKNMTVIGFSKDCWVVVKEDYKGFELLKGQKYQNIANFGQLQIVKDGFDIPITNKIMNLFEVTSKYEITDAVVVISGIKAGCIGTVVELLTDTLNVYEVEFCDDEGRTLYTAVFKEHELVKLQSN